ncbi:hypothetical protein JJQ72_12975 [Paenibacillus sp. F411]|uniref:WYL domain-containing protein n=1 Tax=Paenibacillus algicola TaxID=2565926 RepID=A0A4P8XI75_9BACL|nr:MULTISPECIES: hypothetical protein [Paenibacillus]MBO2944886.1 hypothetical protein [Paenibacillus sp. F411]QCT02276.1 hypothetical protein E6C60_1560 [Paenibacillus algicola]
MNNIRKYIGDIVEIIYIDRLGAITQREIEVLGVRGHLVRADCLKSGAPRVFRTENILAMRRKKGTNRAS